MRAIFSAIPYLDACKACIISIPTCPYVPNNISLLPSQSTSLTCEQRTQSYLSESGRMESFDKPLFRISLKQQNHLFQLVAWPWVQCIVDRFQIKSGACNGKETIIVIRDIGLKKLTYCISQDGLDLLGCAVNIEYTTTLTNDNPFQIRIKLLI